MRLVLKDLVNRTALRVIIWNNAAYVMHNLDFTSEGIM